VVDSITSLKKLSESTGDTDEGIMSLLRFLSEARVTSLLITDLPDPTELQPEMFISRGEIRLHKRMISNRTDRFVSIEKLRGSAHDALPRPMVITEKGIIVDSKKKVSKAAMRSLQAFNQ
jgi:KaiC/GvpD/RAD55 family RecA-like ATPase